MSLLGAMGMVCGVIWWGVAVLFGCVVFRKLLRALIGDA